FTKGEGEGWGGVPLEHCSEHPSANSKSEINRTPPQPPPARCAREGAKRRPREFACPFEGQLSTPSLSPEVEGRAGEGCDCSLAPNLGPVSANANSTAPLPNPPVGAAQGRWRSGRPGISLAHSKASFRLPPFHRRWRGGLGRGAFGALLRTSVREQQKQNQPD